MTAGEHFAKALADGDRAALESLLAADVAFSAVTPGRVWESSDRAEVIDVMLGTWFGGERHIDGIAHIETGSVGDCERVGYRFNATTPSGPSVVEQQAYLTVADGTVTAMRIACSGYRNAAYSVPTAGGR